MLINADREVIIGLSLARFPIGIAKEMNSF